MIFKGRTIRKWKQNDSHFGHHSKTKHHLKSEHHLTIQNLNGFEIRAPTVIQVPCVVNNFYKLSRGEICVANFIPIQMVQVWAVFCSKFRLG